MRGRFPPIRSRWFPPALFGIILMGLLLSSGVHMGFIVLLSRLELSDFVKVNIPLLYWIGLAAAVTALIVRLTRNVYERPLRQIARAARQVAGGDFSVYIPPVHRADKQDFLDELILDFNKMVAELGSSESLKTDFFSNVSHEIKTPLAVIQSSAAILNHGTLTPEQADYVQTILRSSQRLSELISNILKLNKLEKQSTQPVLEPYDLCEQLAQCALLFEERWEEKGIEFEADMEDTATIEADESLLELVWNNLLSNAIKFTGPGGTGHLRQMSGPEWVEISVSDTGCGMSQETMDHIFEKFYQGDTSHAAEGNGLVLALVLRILRMCGGSISAASEAFLPGMTSPAAVMLFAAIPFPPARREKRKRSGAYWQGNIPSLLRGGMFYFFQTTLSP